MIKKHSVRPQHRSVAVILCGGVGERFWPLTDEKNPKYSLSFDGPSPLLAQTYRRIRKLFKPRDIWVITTRSHAGLIAKLLPIPSSRILKEPYRRNTAAAVTYASLWLGARLGKGVVVTFFPADAWIKRENLFVKDIRHCQVYARRYGLLAVIGIKPRYPATGYGYIECGPAMAKPLGGGGLSRNAFRVRRFVEKPDLKRARNFLRNDAALWNAGIFTWTAGAFEEALRRLAPHYWRRFGPLFARGSHASAAKIRKVFRSIAAVSIDRLLLEKKPPLIVLKGGFLWDDVGSFDALIRHPNHPAGNYLSSSGLFHNVRKSVVLTGSMRVIISGVENIVVARKGMRLLVASLDDAQKIRELVRRFQTR